MNDPAPLTDQVGVAISTTGDKHRLGFLETCVRKWCEVDSVTSLFVTVDGDEAALDRVTEAVSEHTGSVYRVGQRPDGESRDGRLGVAISKNTGIELLMNTRAGRFYPTIEHLFLSDDDTWPITDRAIDLHVEASDYLPHSMVCWGPSRLAETRPEDRYLWATWNWPRGVVLYTKREVIENVGGMVEEFGPGGHEHVEWSNRIYNAGFTAAPFLTPPEYAQDSPAGRVTGASRYWNAEDMRKPGESPIAHGRRKRGQTSIRRMEGDWGRIEAVMSSREGDAEFVPYRASDNGRGTATMSTNLTCRGADSE